MGTDFDEGPDHTERVVVALAWSPGTPACCTHCVLPEPLKTDGLGKRR